LKLHLKIKILFSLPAPYEIKFGLRFIRDTNKLVSDKLKIISIDNFNNKSIFSSLNECSKSLHIGISKIKNCLLTGEIYQNYKFILA
jgi:hypothetical protein